MKAACPNRKGGAEPAAYPKKAGGSGGVAFTAWRKGARVSCLGGRLRQYTAYYRRQGPVCKLQEAGKDGAD